jgi:hypothetical protein
MIRSRDYSTLFPVHFPEFWKMVRYIRFADNGCWIWTGILSNGYGIAYLRKRMWAVHRLFFVMFRGHIPEGYVVHHRCNCPSCCNPFHLDAVTQGDNVRSADMPAGPTHYKASLTHCSHGHPLSGQPLCLLRQQPPPPRLPHLRRPPHRNPSPPL